MPKAAPKLRSMPHIARVHRVQQPDENYGQGRGGRPWRRKRARILERDGKLCIPCKEAGRLTLATQVDHIIPKAEGGTDDDNNLQSICGPCHEAKSRAEAARGRNAKGSRFRSRPARNESNSHLEP